MTLKLTITPNAQLELLRLSPINKERFWSDWRDIPSGTLVTVGLKTLITLANHWNDFRIDKYHVIDLDDGTIRHASQHFTPEVIDTLRYWNQIIIPEKQKELFMKVVRNSDPKPIP